MPPVRYSLHAPYLIVRYHPSDLPRVLEATQSELVREGPTTEGFVIAEKGLWVQVDETMAPGHPWPPPREDIARELSARLTA